MELGEGTRCLTPQEGPVLTGSLQHDPLQQAFVLKRLRRVAAKRDIQLGKLDLVAAISMANKKGLNTEIILSRAAEDWKAAMAARVQEQINKLKNSAQYVSADGVQIATTPTKKASGKSKQVVIGMAQRFARLLFKGDDEFSKQARVAVARIYQTKHLVTVTAERELVPPGLMVAIARWLGVYSAKHPPVIPVLSALPTEMDPVAIAGPAFVENGYLIVEGRKALESGTDQDTWYFESLVKTFGDAVTLMSYVLSLTSPLLPGGFFPGLKILFREKILVDSEGNKFPAGVDGSGTYHPDCPELRSFLLQHQAVTGGKTTKSPPTFQIRVWNPEIGLFAKGLLVPDRGSVDENGNPRIILGLNQIKGSMKEAGAVHIAAGTSMELIGHMGVMQAWKNQSTLKSCFQLLQVAKTNEETVEAVKELVAETFAKIRAKGVAALANTDTGGNTTLASQVELVQLAIELGVEVVGDNGEQRPISLLDIQAVMLKASQKLQQRLYNAANGTGFEGNQAVVVMDASVKRGTVVIGTGDKPIPPTGTEVVVWRFPAILPQSMKVLTIADPSPHMLVDFTTHDGVKEGIAAYAAFMNPEDVGDLQGDDDGDILAWTADARVMTLARQPLTLNRYRIEPDGEKVKIDRKDMEKFRRYLSVDPMGPVGQATVNQARLYELVHSTTAYAYALSWAMDNGGGSPDEGPSMELIHQRASSIQHWLDNARDDHPKRLEVEAKAKAYKQLALNWAIAFGVFIQESIDRAKRFVRWTNVPAVALAGEDAWKMPQGTQEFYCHWGIDKDNGVVKYKDPTAVTVSKHYMNYSTEELRDVNPADLLKKFRQRAQESLGTEALSSCVQWRFNQTVNGEALAKRIDPGNFQKKRWSPGLVNVAYEASREQWGELAGEFKIPKVCADLSDLLEKVLERKGDEPTLQFGDVSFTWSAFIRLMKRRIQNPAVLDRWVAARVLWTDKSGEVDQDALDWLIQNGKMGNATEFAPQAILDNQIRIAMAKGTGASTMDLNLGHNANIEDDPSKSPRIQALELAYAQHARRMCKYESEKGISALLVQYAAESSLGGLRFKRSPVRSTAKSSTIAEYRTEYELTSDEKSAREALSRGLYPVVKQARALDLALYEGSPILAHLGLGKKDECLYGSMAERQAVMRFLDGLSADEKIEQLVSGYYSIDFPMGFSEDVAIKNATAIGHRHFALTGKFLYSCQECQTALTKELVTSLRFTGNGKAEKGTPCAKLAEDVKTTLWKDKSFAKATHFKVLHMQIVRELLSLSNAMFDGQGIIPSPSKFGVALGILHEQAKRLGKHVSDHEMPAHGAIPVTDSLHDEWMIVFGFSADNTPVVFDPYNGSEDPQIFEDNEY